MLPRDPLSHNDPDDAPTVRTVWLLRMLAPHLNVQPETTMRVAPISLDSLRSIARLTLDRMHPSPVRYAHQLHAQPYPMAQIKKRACQEDDEETRQARLG